MNNDKMIRNGFVSELDIFLREFDASHPNFGPARQKEISKHKAIAAKRDGVDKENKTIK